VHYIDYKGPSKENKDLVPVHFKRPSSTSIVPSSPLSPPAPKRKKSTAGAKRVTKKSKGTSLGSDENSSVHVASTDQHDEYSHMISSDTACNDFSGDDGDESCTDSTNFHTALSMDLNVEPECAPVSDDMNNQGIDPQPLSAESDPSSSMHLTLSSSHEAVDIESPSDVINIQSTDPQVVAAELDPTVASSSMNVVQSSSHGVVGIEQGHAPSDDMNDRALILPLS